MMTTKQILVAKTSVHFMALESVQAVDSYDKKVDHWSAMVDDGLVTIKEAVNYIINNKHIGG